MSDELELAPPPMVGPLRMLSHGDGAGVVKGVSAADEEVREDIGTAEALVVSIWRVDICRGGLGSREAVLHHTTLCCVWRLCM